MNCKDIIEKYLKENRFDGLFYDGGSEDYCSCHIDDLIPCGGACQDCTPINFNKPLDKTE